MTSEKQVAANRENAKKSTGPRTAEGKARASGNAIKHGLTAKERVVLKDESSNQFSCCWRISRRRRGGCGGSRGLRWR